MPPQETYTRKSDKIRRRTKCRRRVASNPHLPSPANTTELREQKYKSTPSSTSRGLRRSNLDSTVKLMTYNYDFSSVVVYICSSWSSLIYRYTHVCWASMVYILSFWFLSIYTHVFKLWNGYNCPFLSILIQTQVFFFFFSIAKVYVHSF